MLQAFQGAEWHRHLPPLEKALAEMRRPEHRLEVKDLCYRYRGRPISLLGVKDHHRERNLGDYQNMAYYLLDHREQQSSAALVIDPGVRESAWIKELLGIKECTVILSHFHLDHWIGYEAYRDGKIYASPLSRAVLTQMVGAEHTGKSIFAEGRLNDHHRRPLPLRAANDAERLLPLPETIHPVTGTEPFFHQETGAVFFELPYGQTEGTVYGLIEGDLVKILFAGDLFVKINHSLRIEPHYAFKSTNGVINDITVMLKAILGLPTGVSDREAGPWLARIARPDLLAMGHGLFEFTAAESSIAHLLAELEELLRINREHII